MCVGVYLCVGIRTRVQYQQRPEEGVGVLSAAAPGGCWEQYALSVADPSL